MRELQKEGKIGRIEVNVKAEEGKTSGEIEIPSALDKAETTIIAAALETIERIGPSEAQIEIETIEDVRSNKRDYIINRAKELLESISASIPESQEMQLQVKESLKLSKIQEYGKERLPAGDLSSKEIIVVEGRADVQNLIRHNIKNVIGMNGTNLPETIKELSKDKELTLFIDGDRGGILIAKNVLDNANITYVAQAPSGKEVEELTAKDILICLRKKVPAEEFLKEIEGEISIKKKRTRIKRKSSEENKETSKEKEIGEIKEISEKEMDKLKEISDSIVGTKNAIILDSNLNVLKKVPKANLEYYLLKLKKEVFAIVIDGTVTYSIIELAEKTPCNYIIAKNFANIKDTNIKLLSL